ncbi:hypothetical protein INR49_028601 [Caranx melampygus]|nr:hypothetical protein INR49_028601 [Caranx melampygus]
MVVVGRVGGDWWGLGRRRTGREIAYGNRDFLSDPGCQSPRWHFLFTCPIDLPFGVLRAAPRTSTQTASFKVKAKFTQS